jgi:hypothetical protein
VEDNRHDPALVDRESDAGRAASPAESTVPAARSAAALDRAHGTRNRRGSLGPSPVAQPVHEDAPDLAFRAHLAHLLEATRVPVERDPGASQEDLERAPDGVPHAVVGLTVVFSLVAAVVLVGLFLAGDTIGKIAAVALAVLAVPTLVIQLGAKAERERDHDHPSR